MKGKWQPCTVADERKFDEFYEEKYDYVISYVSYLWRFSSVEINVGLLNRFLKPLNGTDRALWFWEICRGDAEGGERKLSAHTNEGGAVATRNTRSLPKST